MARHEETRIRSATALSPPRTRWLPFGIATGSSLGAAVVWQGLVGDATGWWILACASATLAGYFGGSDR